MSGRKFNIDRSSGEIETLWPQSEIKQRFRGVQEDLPTLFTSIHELSMKYPVEYRGVFLKGAECAIEGLKIIFEERFDELNRTGQTGQTGNKFIRDDDDKIDLGEI